MASDDTQRLAVDGGEPVRTRPFAPWPLHDERDEAAVLRVLRSGQWGWYGPEIPQFEEEFARAQDAKFAVTVSSGSAALEVALAACGVGLGDEVIVPVYTFFATASACLMRGAIPVFADVDPLSWNMDARDAESKITSRTKAIIPVHIAGCPANLDAIRQVGQNHGLTVIEDAAQAHGAQWRGRAVGAIADLGCFSFQASKNINSGEGGAVVTDDEDLAERSWSFKNYGRNRRNTQWHGHDAMGTNFRMTEFQAALLRSQLERLDEWATQRTRNAEYLINGLREIDGLTPQQPDEGVTRHAYHGFITRFDSKAFGGRDRDWFCEAMEAEGITAFAGYAIPMYRQPAISDSTHNLLQSLGRETSEDALGWTRCPVSEQRCRDTVWLGTQNQLLGTTEHMDDILRAISKIQRAVGS